MVAYGAVEAPTDAEAALPAATRAVGTAGLKPLTHAPGNAGAALDRRSLTAGPTF
jgi:hypothetical protein